MSDTTRTNRTAALLDAIDEARLWRRHMDLGAIGATPKGGVNRQALSPEEARGRRLIADWAKELGFTLTVDPVGNLFIRREGTEPNLDPVVTGSHIDSQPTGGKFDGAYGVLAGFEVLEALERAGIETRRPLVVAAWLNEEGSRFMPGCSGSAAFTGKISEADALDIQDRDGIVARDCLPEMIAATPEAEQIGLGFPIHAYIENHIEQGPRLEEAELPVGVVTSIQGMHRYEIDVRGDEAHAGTTPIALRKDAFKSAIDIAKALEELMHDPDDVIRFTIGRFETKPGSPNVVPGHVHFTIDFRHPDQDLLMDRGGRIEEVAKAHAGPCDVKVKRISAGAPVAFPDEMVATVRAAAEEAGHPYMEMPSGAGHDAGLLAPVCPVAMIFVPCEKGISHNEAENALPGDLHKGTQVLGLALMKLAG
ncbi:MAG: M20 family metallo-hydrolase [Alphaproteobacteria bacterium]|nr:M20 family metallo-hydrolase [Alphaproteobacteria bacterium]